MVKRATSTGSGRSRTIGAMRSLPVVAVVACVAAGCGCPETRPGDFPDEAAMRVTVSDEIDAAPFFACEGFAGSSDACRESASLLVAGSTWSGGQGAFVATTGPRLFGYFYRVEAEAREGGRARVCRLYVTDVPSEECEPGYECAASGEVVLTSGGGATVHAVFEGGATLEAAIAAPPAM